jgi:hypothetical protein
VRDVDHLGNESNSHHLGNGSARVADVKTPEIFDIGTSQSWDKPSTKTVKAVMNWLAYRG